MLVELLFMSSAAALAQGAEAEAESAAAELKISAIIIPGFASSQLRAWALLDCPFSPLDFKPLDSVWLDSRKVISVTNCWLKCILLDPYNQTDHPECSSRPDTGLSAITEIDPGYITGALSTVWREWVHWLVEFGIDANVVTPMPYDWRLPGSLLEKRDMYFYRLKIAFETALKLHGVPALVFAHSMGNSVFRYFLEWLRFEVAPRRYQAWINDHIYAYVAVGAPLLGSAEALKATLSGLTFGLPMAEGTARRMCNSFGASLWMLPLSEHSHVSEVYKERDSNAKHSKDKRKKMDPPYHFDWPTDVAEIQIPEEQDAECPMEVIVNGMAVCNMHTKRAYSAAEVADGTLFQEIAHFDQEGERAIYQLKKFYLEDAVVNGLTPWSRPPIRNIFCAYGINMKTEVGYRFAPTGKPYPDNWIITDTVYEVEGGTLQSRSGAAVEGNPSPASGDGTLPYNSLSFCKTWLGSRVNITRVPQTSHDGSDVQEVINYEHLLGTDIVPNMSRDTRVNYITFYEDETSYPGRKTAVWEFDKVNHRNMVRSPHLMRELWLELIYSGHPAAQRKFMPKGVRYPIRDEDCFWDYAKARCAVSEYCEYRYVFGDVHLGQSCRLKPSKQSDLLVKYL
ncbi:hypothetical protein GOP47_0000525 [Adiantum capillus-veneris]|uniref:Phospholipid--sterol O-acyltransferase n=1 Tax=Adiantum capillus-veneris TaxID=13818 RepID=A0A9D4ZSE4_ADICA|nr:hypothetical protein GOP47_0000525 [Adiantum capillus-veneris]